MTNAEKTKTFFRCLVVMLWVLATIIVVANTWNRPTSGFVNACAFIALAGGIAGIVRFTKSFIDKP